MNRKALVTGAGGFIGSHLTEGLVAAGYQVRAMVHYNARGRSGWLEDMAPDVKKSVEVVAGDIRDGAYMRRVSAGVDVVFHLAALIGIPYSYVAPESYVDVNVRGTLNVLDAARDGGAKVIQTSTSEVYGTAQRVPIDETHPLNAQSPYAATKVAADQLALSFHRSFGVPVTVVRPFNTYGPRQSTRAVIPTIIAQALAGAKTLKLGALTPTRDMTLVRDTVAGFIAADRSASAIGEVINLGTGYEASIGDIASIIAEEIGVQVAIERDPKRDRPATSEVERLISDNGKAAKILKWQPVSTGAEGLRAGLRETIVWYRRSGAVKVDGAIDYGL